MILLAMLLTCIAVECSVASALIPLALILLIVGILLFHCGWAAHLLDDSGQIPIRKTVNTTTTTYEDPESDLAEQRLFVSAYREPIPEVKQGYWQFDERESWQAVANPYPIEHTLKHCLDDSPIEGWNLHVSRDELTLFAVVWTQSAIFQYFVAICPFDDSRVWCQARLCITLLR